MNYTPFLSNRQKGDNRCVLRRVMPYDSVRHQRLLQRTTVSGDPAEPATR
jgi:hypothetical protein